MIFPLPSERQTLWLFGISIALAAYFNIGFIQADEHFQILEFAAYKLGIVQQEGLAWEYNAQIRSGLQPFLAYLTIGAGRALGITNPFWHALLLRFLTGFGAAWLYYLWLQRLKSSFTNVARQHFFVVLACLTWFVPFLLVRFSSENMSSIAFFGGLYLLLQTDKNGEFVPTNALKNVFLAGLLFSFSFFFRFQIAFALLGLGAWLLYKRTSVAFLLVLLIAGFLGGAVGMCSDFWLYGEWVLSPVRYFICNIVEHKAAEFGVEPFYWYFTDAFAKIVPPLSLLLIVGFIVGCYTARTNVFTWFTLPFLLGHSAIAHKEGRFLFPLLLAFLYLSAIGMQFIWQKSKFYFYKKPKTYRSIGIFMLSLNAGLLLFRCLTPANELISYQKFLYDYSLQNPKTLIVSLGADDMYHENQTPFQQFYHPLAPTLPITDTSELQCFLKESQPERILVLQPQHLIMPQTEGYTRQAIYNLLPSYAPYFNFNHWQDRSNFWQVHLLTKKK